MSILDEHEHIALHFSGGRDSLAVLHLLADELDRITVYWLNTGDAFPETLEMVDKAREWIPNFVEIKSDSEAIIAAYGLPSDLVPVSCTPMGVAMGMSDTLVQDTYSFYARLKMQPIAERMIQDDISLVIRGQRQCDIERSPVNSGFEEGGITYHFPIEDWTPEDVDGYLESKNIKLPRFYDYLDTSPDCMTIPGEWWIGKGEYLKQFHPDAYEIYQTRLKLVGDLCSQHIAQFNTEIEGD